MTGTHARGREWPASGTAGARPAVPPGAGAAGGGAARGRHGRGSPPARGLSIFRLADCQPDAEDLFLRPGEPLRAPRGSARHRAGGRLRGAGRGLLAVAVLGGCAAVALLGGTSLGALLGGTSPGGTAAASPGRGAGPRLTPLPAAAALPPGAADSPASAPAVQPSRMGRDAGPRVPPRSAAPGPAATGPAATGPASAASAAAPPAAVPPAAVPPAAVPPAAAAGGQRGAAVSYAVTSRWPGGFQAEIDVRNGGTSPVSGWQIVVVLPEDQVMAVRNATGYVSNHILLLHQAHSWSSLAPGGTLRVILTVWGARTTPELCAFDNTACGYGG